MSVTFRWNRPFEIYSNSVKCLPAISCFFLLILYLLFYHLHSECDSSVTSPALGHVINDGDNLWYKLIVNYSASTQLPSSPVYRFVLLVEINFLYIKNLFIIFCLLEINILIKLHACAYLVSVSKSDWYFSSKVHIFGTKHTICNIVEIGII